MTEHLVTCSFCGHPFNPLNRAACPSCPLNKGCQLVCCPACGYETIDVNESLLARLATNLFNRQHKSEATTHQTDHQRNRDI